ncbi:MAG: 2Fe-2S iron-sulfur cluster binding domain-containing protein [Lachnospiraceae bacterium]|nr:2Fe-2S iron-sulfur cluster binding domain-containing protein [Lachnospiraceae bacterium]
MSNQDYLKNVPIEDFDKLIPTRRGIIEAASDEFPKYEYNANVLAKNLHPAVQHVVVSDVKDLNGAKYITFAPDKEAGTEKLALFRAGQYISLRLQIGESNLTRPYSLCSSPKDALNGTYSILIKQMKNGFASEYICQNFKPGTKLDISGPEGFFNYEPIRDAAYVIGLAGGSGIAPFLSLAKAVADGTEDFHLTILFGSRTENDILLKDEFDALQSACNKIKVVHVLSDEEKEGYEHGFISADLIAKYAPIDDYSVFVCGSQGMYDYIEGETAKLGLRKKFVRFDAYGEYRLSDRDSEFTNANAGKTYQITVVTNDGQTRTIPAKAEESVLVALERAGIKAPSKCRSGECGFCRSRLASGEVYVPEKVERRRQYDKVEGYIHPCATFPESDLKILINCEEPKKERKVKDMKKKERLMGLIMAIIISAVMGICATVLVRLFNEQTRQSPIQVMLIPNVLMSIALGVLISFVLPLGKLGKSLAAKAHANPPSFKFTLLNAIPISLINTAIIGFILSGVGVFMARRNIPAEAYAGMPPFMRTFPGMWAVSFLEILIPTMVISYLLAVILSPVISQAIGLADAGAEVGRAQSEDK